LLIYGEFDDDEGCDVDVRAGLESATPLVVDSFFYLN